METANCFKTFPDLKNHLTASKGGPDKNRDLNKHLSDIMDHIIIHCPTEAFNKLEEISYLIKNSDTVAMDKFLKINERPTYAQPADTITK